jgi:glutamine amidotransferase
VIAIVDTGGANLASVVNALERLGAAAEVTGDPARVRAADAVILPGVGAAPEAAARLAAGGLGDAVRGLTVPVLGICLGMQLFFDDSEEGPARGLGLLPGTVGRMAPKGLTVPHMGWNAVTRTKENPLLEGIDDGSHFYFVHSYAAPAGPWVDAACDYGGPVPAVVSKDNFLGVQFHPERSGAAGARVLKNFLSL